MDTASRNVSPPRFRRIRIADREVVGKEWRRSIKLTGSLSLYVPVLLWRIIPTTLSGMTDHLCPVVAGGGGMIKESWCFEQMAEVLAAMPPIVDPTDVLRPELLLFKQGSLSLRYCPFDTVNPTAKVLIIGITPGLRQMFLSCQEAQRAWLMVKQGSMSFFGPGPSEDSRGRCEPTWWQCSTGSGSMRNSRSTRPGHSSAAKMLPPHGALGW